MANFFFNRKLEILISKILEKFVNFGKFRNLENFINLMKFCKFKEFYKF